MGQNPECEDPENTKPKKRGWNMDSAIGISYISGFSHSEYFKIIRRIEIIEFKFVLHLISSRVRKSNYLILNFLLK